MNQRWLFLGFVLSNQQFIYGQDNCYKSQYGQDRILNEYIFHDKRNGVFIDIGAYDGVHYSNTYFFEKTLGWTGICFELNQHVAERLTANRSCVCFDVCVGDVEEIVPIIWISAPANVEMLGGRLATYNFKHWENMRSELQKVGGWYSVLTKESIRLDTVLKKNAIKKIDYLSLGVEGGQLDILQTLNFDEVEVSAISVKDNYAHGEIRKFLESKKFVFLGRLSECDEIYLHHKYLSSLNKTPIF